MKPAIPIHGPYRPRRSNGLIPHLYLSVALFSLVCMAAAFAAAWLFTWAALELHRLFH